MSNSSETNAVFCLQLEVSCLQLSHFVHSCIFAYNLNFYLHFEFLHTVEFLQLESVSKKHLNGL